MPVGQNKGQALPLRPHERANSGHWHVWEGNMQVSMLWKGNAVPVTASTGLSG